MAMDPRTLNPISIEKKLDFLVSPPQGWRLDAATGQMRCEDNSVTVMVQDKKFEGRDTVLEVDSIESLNAYRNLVMSKPIVTTAICRKPYYYDKNTRLVHSEGRRESLAWQEDEYIVLINTQHPQVAQMFDEAFRKADEYLREGNIFRITVGISESLRVYYINNVHVPHEHNDQAIAYNCDIFITHGVGSPSFADNCFACKNSPQIAMWVFCFPCCLLTGVPYIAYKKCFKGLKESEVKRGVPVIYHQGPFQMGFNLLNLLYPPGTTFTTITTNVQTAQPYPNAPGFYPPHLPPTGYGAAY